MDIVDEALAGRDHCCKCCLDMDIDPLDMIFPERMSDAGREFVRAHGLDDAKLIDLRQNALLLENGLVKIQHRCQQLDELGLCRIYESRPEICREYDCSKRTGADACLRFHHE